MKNLFHLTLLVFSLALPSALADDGYGPTGELHAPSAYRSPAGLVHGGAFIDRILPMPVTNGLRSDVWGGDNVKPRNVENGIEDPSWSYWCNSTHQGPDGKYHMFAVRWAENDPRGHSAWPDSEVVHAVSDSPLGPFKFKEKIGPGHNVMCYRAKDGTYVLYVNDGGYSSKSLDGPWSKYEIKYDQRGTRPVSLLNLAFTPREDGSILMVSRTGQIWISEDGLKPFRKITTKTLYPRIPGHLEDPIIWRDEVQYHLIVNDWLGRVAFYLRSPDGVHWTWDQGKAYDIEVVSHPDGSKEGWHKFERPNVLQDASGRATDIYFAVMDAPKELDLGSDNHSSKIIALPLVVERHLSIIDPQPITADTQTIQVKIAAEEGFDPLSDLDADSLHFGPPSEVDYGKGGKALKVEPAGADLVVTFDAAKNGFKPTDAVAKLLGKNKDGYMVLGYVRLPGHTAATAILSAQPPKLTKPDQLTVIVENFGLATSAPTTIRISLDAEGRQSTTTSTAELPAIKPYGSVTVNLPTSIFGFAPGKPITAETLIDQDSAVDILQSTIEPIDGP